MKYNNLRFESWSKPVSCLILTLLFALGLQGCQDGITNEAQPQTSINQSTYSGPAARTEDIQSFRINLWENLRSENRCGACHNSGGQAPTFVQEDDVNLAYAAATPLVNRNDIENSLLITKVAAGHNCWEPVDSVCTDLLTTFVERWVGSEGVSGNQIVLEPPVIIEVGESRTFPGDSSLFTSYVHPLLTTYCADCHQEAAPIPQSPYFATADADAAYAAVKAQIDLDTPANSRLVLRLREFHNCWDDCTDNADEMQTAITLMADGIPPTTVDPALVVSKALRLEHGTIASGGSRHETDVVALYEFKAGSGNTVFDRSGVDPALNLTMNGDITWVSGWGIEINSGKAQGTTSASKKLSDLIKATGEYSIEAWVVPANVTQEGPARIVSYSAGNDSRNFTMGQTQYNYNFLHRSSTTDGNGEPDLSTADADEDLQATEQHVVMTFDPTNGRRIFVNGVFTDDLDEAPGGNLVDWDDSFALVLGNEVSGERQWQGKIRLLAIHNRALTQEQISQNYEVGVGEKYFLLFSVSDLLGLTESYVVFEVSQFDEYSYLFRKPRFISLDASVQPSGIPIAGMRIGINGKEAAIGQAYTHLSETIGSNYTPGEGQLLSTLGTVIPLEKGPASDEFFLSFEQLAGHTHVFTEPAVLPPGAPTDNPAAPEIGLRTFEEIDASMAVLTGVSRTDSGVRATYETIKQQLPSSENVNGFLSAHQIGVSQLAIEYCSALVDDNGLRSNLFAGFSFATDANDISFESWRDSVVTPLIDRFMGQGLSSQPLVADVQNELLTLLTDTQDNKPYDENGVALGDGLPDGLARCGGPCGAGRTEVATKAACAALLGSAVMLVQ
jgi:hypothetical protein